MKLLVSAKLRKSQKAVIEKTLDKKVELHICRIFRKISGMMRFPAQMYS